MAEWLNGKKTYITAALVFIVAGLHAIRKQIPVLNTIPDETWQAVMDWLQAGGIAMLFTFLRMGVKKDTGN